ncbi:MAG TPA: glycoside hydrolase family 3 N-terminal domain-containing protein [Jatrophihabitans sp.]
MSARTLREGTQMTSPDSSDRPWQDTSLPIADRVEALLRELTLEEKVAQLGSRWLLAHLAVSTDRDDDESLNVAPMQDVFASGAAATLEDASRHGLGHLTRVYGSGPVAVSAGASELVRQHHVVLANSAHGIPALAHEECLTGLTSYGATVYPTALAWGATFDPDLIERMAATIGRDMAALGIHQGLSPVLDVVRDYRWGRVEETIGEDPYLVSVIGSAYVRGLQSAGVIATLKHFAGYSASRAARNHGPVSMGRRELIDVVLPPFEAAVREAGARSVMNSYADVDGVPAGADPWLLTDVLREQWGFAGTVVSDYWAVPFLATMHRIAGDLHGAGAAALNAGIDIELPDTIGFGARLVEGVKNGDVDVTLVDRAARRVLAQKVELGLLDPDWTPEASVRDAASVELDPAANRDLAREIAERSIVLLDAGTALPISGADRPQPQRIAVVGPCADNPRTFLGCYSFPNHVAVLHPGTGLGVEVPTAVDALRAELPGVEIVHEAGCDIREVDESGFAAAVSAACDADLCIVFVGDLASLFGRGTSGEGCDVDDLQLPGVQAELVERLLDTGTPTVVVVVSGRPYALGEVAGRAAGLVQAFLPGEEGGAAIAGVLSGRVQPSAKLPVQIPRHRGAQPSTYLQPPLGGAESNGISTIDASPLFPFGFGASYTSFAIEDARTSTSELATDGELEVSAIVRNTGSRTGSEVVQLYAHDVIAQVARPTRQLIGFARVSLDPGQSRAVRFHVHSDRFAYTNGEYQRIVEPGDVELLIGNSAADLPCRESVRLTGPTRIVGSDRRLITPVEVGASER